MSYTTADPVQNNVERVIVRQSATGFEQGIAAIIGLCTAGPLGALASWGTLRGLQGKWTPWFLLGLPAAPVLLVGQLVVVGAAMDTPDRDPRTFSNAERISLQSTCYDLRKAKQQGDVGESFRLGYTIGSEYGTSDVDGACAAVGVRL